MFKRQINQEEVKEIIDYCLDEMGIEWQMAFNKVKRRENVRRRRAIFCAMKGLFPVTSMQLSEISGIDDCTIRIDYWKKHDSFIRLKEYELAYNAAVRGCERWIRDNKPADDSTVAGSSTINLESFSKRLSKLVYGKEARYRVGAA